MVLDIELCQVLMSWIVISILQVKAELTLDLPLGVTDSRELVVEPGSQFSLTCRGDTPVTWDYNDYQPNEGDTRSVVELDEGEKFGEFESTLTLSGAYFLDTGFYYCRPKDQGRWSPERESIYVYVKDPVNPLAINDTWLVLSALEGSDVLIPCRPTDPTSKVSLVKDEEVVEEAKYDPHVGFTIHVNTIHDSGQYECIVKDSDNSFWLHLVVHLRTLKEDVEAPHVSASPEPVVRGLNVTLECSVHYDLGVKVNLLWSVPNPTLITSGHIKLHPITPLPLDQKDGDHIKGEKAIHKLTIYDVNKDDEGAYTCSVEDNSHNHNNKTYNLRVLTTTVLTLSFRGNVSPGKTEVRMLPPGLTETMLVVDITAHPSPKYLQWYDNNMQAIKSDGMLFTVKDSNKESQLTIHNPGVHSSGTYTLVVNNDAFNKSINATIQVKGAPEVRVNEGRSEGYFLVNHHHTLNCDVFGFPRPNISWYFSPCEQYPSCSAVWQLVPPSQYTELEVNSLRGMIQSSVTLWYNLTGLLSCMACSGLGCNQDNVTVIATDVEKVFDISVDTKMAPGMVVETDNITLSCGASKYNYSSALTWLYAKDRTSLAAPQPVTDFKVWTTKTEYSFFTNLNIPNVTKEHSGYYVCSAPYRHSRSSQNRTIYFMDVKKIEKPKIYKTDVRTKWAVRAATKVRCACHVTGTPPPSIFWYKDGVELNKKPNIKMGENNETLEITVGLEDDATYSCVTKNTAGTDTLSCTIELTDKPRKMFFWFFMYVLPVVVVVAAVVAFIYFRSTRKLKKEIRELTEAGLLHFEEGNVGSLNPELDIGEQADLLPYDRKKWEFPRDRLKLGKQLGAGAFGVVLKAEAYELLEEGVSTTVAVKMVKRNSDIATIKALASEVKIMIHLGKHLNVVNVLGACTGDLNKRELLVLVEYCQYGNLHNYLLKHRGAFINQVNSRTGMFDPTLIQPTSPTSPGFSDLPFGNGDLNYNGKMSMRTSAAFSQATDTTLLSDMSRAPGGGADVSVQSTPVGDDGYLVSRDHEWRNSCRGDYREQDGLRPVCTQDLICWGFQIARGMEYLASRKVLHGDLAARNVLLADDNIVKICDFGFSKSMYRDSSYHKKGDGPLPVKWMALESIRDRVFSSQSDVWAYGITLWEMFSLACTPYPGMEVDEKLFNKLEDGYRMEQPKYATKNVYQVMIDCWHVNPHSRPSFTELAERMGGMLEDTVRTHYVDLNDPFLQENREFLAQQDYLSMLRSPTYANWSPEIEGYMPMKSPTRKDALNEEPMELTPMLDQSAMSDSESVPNSPTTLLTPKAGASVPDSPDGSPTITKPTGNNYVNVAQVMGFSNPSYHNVGRPKQSPYINMP